MSQTLKHWKEFEQENQENIKLIKRKYPEFWINLLKFMHTSHKKTQAREAMVLNYSPTHEHGTQTFETREQDVSQGVDRHVQTMNVCFAHQLKIIMERHVMQTEREGREGNYQRRGGIGGAG
ncbi:uncharacterized protein LOC105188082 [Harpegnathos saltator]|uniref:uncharacterized protein LOC105188082 n=1 Tax=Harpegnathos saltator TaxID=610380 RepID=UPI00058BE9C4|nr:uncharacterized protein LOC105188082 [Harpegnathos saltator]